MFPMDHLAREQENVFHEEREKKKERKKKRKKKDAMGESLEKRLPRVSLGTKNKQRNANAINFSGNYKKKN